MNTKSRYEKLKQQIHSHNYRYHVLDAPVISDAEFDKLLNELKQIEAEHPDWITTDSPTLRAGARPADRFEKVRHPAPILRAEQRPFDSIPRETWDRLAAKDPWATPFAEWAFHRAWWDAYGANAHDQTIVIVDPASSEPERPVAIAPLMHRHVVEASHLAGMIATLIVGTVSDYFNRASVLMFMGAAGALGSLLMGGSANWGPCWTLLLVSIGSFFILGDSGVLSAAMADNVPPQQLGSVMGWRSLLGFGIGSFAPFSFGVVMDTTHSWGASYAVLACGGGVACLAACLLWRQHLK